MKKTKGSSTLANKNRLGGGVVIQLLKAPQNAVKPKHLFPYAAGSRSTQGG